MDSLIYTYALIKALYDQGHDYVDSFWPFAVKVMSPDKFESIIVIQKKIKEIGLKIPLHVLDTILERAEKKKLLQRQNDNYEQKNYKLTKSGSEYQELMETERDTERRINALLDEIRIFFNKKKVLLKKDQIHDLLITFLHRNIDSLIVFIDPSDESKLLNNRNLRPSDKHIIEYLSSVEENNPESFLIIRDMIIGSIISTVLNVKETAEMINIQKRQFQRTQIFLDSNFIFSLLDMQGFSFSLPAKELFEMLKKHNFDIRVFSFTVDEISSVIQGFINESYMYPKSIRIDSLYSNMVSKGWTNTRAKEFIFNIENILSSNSIHIERIQEINLSDYEPEKKKIEEIRKYKPERLERSLIHDLAAIEMIKEKRKKPMRRIENSKAFFLTEDGKLSRFNLAIYGHKINGTVCEVLSSKVLTNILWLKNPSSSLPLKSIISTFSKGLFIKRLVWTKFYGELTDLRKKGTVSDENISTLFYHQQIEDVLREFDETELDEITPKFVISEIEKASTNLQKELQQERDKRKEAINELGKLKEKEEYFITQLNEEKRKAKEIDKAYSIKINRIKENVRQNASTQGKKYSTILTLFATITLIITIILVFFFLSTSLLSIFLTLFLSGGIIGFWKAINKRLEIYFTNRIFKQKMSEIQTE